MKRFISFRSIQSQLILYFAVAVLVPAGITYVVGMKLIQDQVITRAETKTLSDLNSAGEIFHNGLAQIEGVVRLTAARSLIINALEENNRQFLQKDLPKILTRERLDILTIVDSKGMVVCRGRNPGQHGDMIVQDRFVARSLASRKMVSGIDILRREELLKESDMLAEQARMEVIPTPKAKPMQDSVITSGMMLKVAAPVIDDSGKCRGVLIGGILVNRDFEIVDKIKDVVHEQEVYEGEEIGTATIFQGPVRISTNVRNMDGSRAISTLVSGEVDDAVLRDGGRWLGPAFVVNTWYLAAYEPLRDIDDRIVGILYVGILKKPFDDILTNSLMTFLAVSFVGMLIVILVSFHQAKKLSQPLKRLEVAAGEIAKGNYGHRVHVQAPREIDRLASSINQMAGELEKEQRELEEWGTKLEKKVAERTDEIRKIHSQLFRSEKLASLGKLAAGVAHEINNPLTGVLTNSSLMLEDMDASDPRREDMEIIVRETIRCREIVKRLLDFARQTKPMKKQTNVNMLLENIILLVRNQASFRNITITKDLYPSLPEILADTDQIQQVFINIVLNAAEAMTRGGSLSIVSSMSAAQDTVDISFADTGPGISEQNRERIFDPFFTTKEQGTGLGLAISYGIIEQHGGTINVDSEPGKGSVFCVRLPVVTAATEGAAE